MESPPQILEFLDRSFKLGGEASPRLLIIHREGTDLVGLQ